MGEEVGLEGVGVLYSSGALEAGDSLDSCAAEELAVGGQLPCPRLPKQCYHR